MSEHSKSAHLYRQGYIYFIYDGEAIKIGYSIWAESRLRELQTSQSRQLQLLGHFLAHPHEERAVHARFARLNIRGEWFRPEEELMDFISKLEAYRPLIDSHRASITDVLSDKIIEVQNRKDTSDDIRTGYYNFHTWYKKSMPLANEMANRLAERCRWGLFSLGGKDARQSAYLVQAVAADFAALAEILSATDR